MNHPKTKQEIAQEISDTMLNRDRQRQAEFIDEFVELVKPEMTKVPENVFRTMFLPYLVGQKEPTAEENPIAHWRGLVGPTSPAAVVDMTGQTLFVVPPLYDTSRIDTTRKNPSRLATAFNDFEQTRSNRPVMATQQLANNLAEEAITIRESVSPTSQYSWEDCYRYYGLSTTPEKANSKPATDVSDSKIDPSEFSFDD